MAGAAILGLSPILVRVSELGPQATSFWRFALALPILAAAALARRGVSRRPDRAQAWVLLAAGVCFGLDIALWSAALDYTTVANSTLLSNMTPIYAAMVGWFAFKERLGGPVLAGGAVALIGAMVLAFARAQSGQGPAESASAGWFGDMLAFFSAFWYAAYLIIVRALAGRVSVIWVLFMACIGSAALALTATLVMGERLWPATLQGWAVLAALGILVQVFGQGFIAYGVARLPIAVSTVLLWVQPVAAAAISWVLFGEALGPLAFAGAGLVLGGVFMVQRARAAELAAKAAP
jgi:drug/metabolite transporter (DMT)-like permease